MFVSAQFFNVMAIAGAIRFVIGAKRKIGGVRRVVDNNMKARFGVEFKG